jgi:ABC-type glycerol-3-phosphate transport system permease component
MSTRAETASAAPARVAADARRATPRRRRLKWGTVVTHGVLLTACAVILFPLAWVALLSIKSLPDAYTNRIWPHHFDFGSYHRALTTIDTLPQNFENSIVVTVATMAITTAVAVLAGYALVHLPTPGKRLVLAIFVASLFVPSRVVGLISIWEIQDRLGLINSTWGLILPYQTLALAVSVFIMRGVFETIPKELAESARVDGAGSFMILRRIMLPLVRNGVIVVVITNFIAAWGEWLIANTLTNDQDKRTLTVVMAAANAGFGQWLWPNMAAMYVIAILPGLLAFAFAQRWYMRGLQEGALKG